jgi:hypothetical protein
MTHASARFSKFVIQRSTLGHELRKPKGTSNSMILVPLFDLKFLRRTRGTRCRNFKSAALARVRVEAAPRGRLGRGTNGGGTIPRMRVCHRTGGPGRAGGVSCARRSAVPSWERSAAGDMTPRSIAKQGSAIARRKRRPEVPAVTSTESMLDESLEQTFPASDPPSWTIVTRIGSPRRKPRSLDDFES